MKYSSTINQLHTVSSIEMLPLTMVHVPDSDFCTMSLHCSCVSTDASVFMSTYFMTKSCTACGM